MQQGKKMQDTKAVENIDKGFIMKNLGGSLSESLEKIPGLSSISIGSSQGKPVIRGLGFNRVAVIEDNIRHESQQWGSDHGLEIDQYSVVEAEVVKGPSSLEYGSDAVGGVLKINTLKIPKKNTVSGSVNLASKSSNGLFGASASVSARKEKILLFPFLVGLCAVGTALLRFLIFGELVGGEDCLEFCVVLVALCLHLFHFCLLLVGEFGTLRTRG